MIVVLLVIAAVAVMIAWLVTINRRWNEAIEADRLQEQIRAQRNQFLTDRWLLTNAQRAFQQRPDASTAPVVSAPMAEYPVADIGE